MDHSLHDIELDGHLPPQSRPSRARLEGLSAYRRPLALILVLQIVLSAFSDPDVLLAVIPVELRSIIMLGWINWYMKQDVFALRKRRPLKQ